MFPVLLVLLIVVPLAELWVIVQVAELVGLVPTIVLLLVVSIAGAALLKQQGLQTWRRLRETLGRGQMPADEASDGALILLGGALLLTPGFVTDVAGLLLLVPPARTIVKRVARRWLARRGTSRLAGFMGARRSGISVVKVERRSDAGASSSPAEVPEVDRGEAGSRDRG